MKNRLFGFFDKERLFFWILYWVVLGLGFITLTFIVTGAWIGFEVKDNCIAAQGKYNGDCVEALISVLEDENNSYRERNSAIWSLGQMGEDRSLETLNRYYTGDIPDRESLNEGISQYELRKAINLIENGINITHIVWDPDDLY